MLDEVKFYLGKNRPSSLEIGGIYVATEDLQVDISTEKGKKVTFGHYLDNFTWKEISDLSKSGQASKVFKIGDTKTISPSFSSNRYYTFTIVGFNHDTLVDGSSNSITFCMDFTSQIKWSNKFDSTSGYWEDSSCRTTTLAKSNLSSVAFNSDVFTYVRAARKSTYDINPSTTAGYLSYTTDDEFFLLSSTEIGLANTSMEGKPYEFFTTKNRRRYFSQGPYWLRGQTDTKKASCWNTTTDTVSGEDVTKPQNLMVGFCI